MKKSTSIGQYTVLLCSLSLVPAAFFLGQSNPAPRAGHALTCAAAEPLPANASAAGSPPATQLPPAHRR